MLAIIQARMTSKRLPGKVLKLLRGKAVLGFVIEQIKQTNTIDDFIVATSSDLSDDRIEEYCKLHRINYYRGPLENVAERFVKAVKKQGANSFVRVNGDSPLIDPIVIDHAVNLYNQSPCDLVTNTMVRTFPKGQSVEVLNTETFFKVFSNMKEADDMEHVTPPYYKQPQNYRIINFTSGRDAGSVQLSIDTHKDFLAVERILKYCDGKPPSWKELVELEERLTS